MLVLLTTITGVAQVRRSYTYSTFVSSHPSSVTISNFSAGGFFAIAGGVVFQGSSTFYLESSIGRQVVPAANISLSAVPDGNVYLNVGSDAYRLEIHRGLACPLGKFIERNGTIVYTLPPATFLPQSFSKAELSRELQQFESEGVALVKDENTGRIMGLAKEFVRTPFLDLIEESDFGKVVPLPPNLRRTLMMNVNTGVNAGDSESEGTYINSDSQVTYQVFLVAASRRVETAGVPLRFTWDYASVGAKVIDVEALSQSWPAGTTLSDFNSRRARPTQYDIVSMFQNAAIFRQLKNSNPSAFYGFVASVCGN